MPVAAPVVAPVAASVPVAEEVPAVVPVAVVDAPVAVAVNIRSEVNVDPALVASVVAEAMNAGAGVNGAIGRRIPSEAPATVRITANKSVTGPDRRPWFLGFRAVYSGDKAAWLWANHRDVAEVYPVKAKG